MFCEKVPWLKLGDLAKVYPEVKCQEHVLMFNKCLQMAKNKSIIFNIRNNNEHGLYL